MLLRRSSFATFAVFAVVALARCQCTSPLSAIPVPQIEIIDAAGDSTKTATPWLKVNLGDADSGHTVSQELQLKNIGKATLQVKTVCLVSATDLTSAKKASCAGQTVGAFSVSSTGNTLVKASASEPLTVTFSPTSGGPVSVFVQVTSDAGDSPVTAFELDARGTDGRLCADPAGLYDFGDVNLGTTANGKITVTNCGVKPVTITTFEFSQNPDNAFTFTPENAAATVGATLNGGDKIVLDVTFTPAQPQAYHDQKAGDIHVVTAAPYAAEYDLILEGNGVRPPACAIGIVPTDGNVNFGAVASNTSATRQVFVVSQGQCACTVNTISDLSPSGTPFTLSNLPALPFTLKGTVGCTGDPADAASAPTSVSVEVDYTSPDRQTPQEDDATFDITTSDPAHADETIHVSANGGGAPFCQLQVTPVAGQTTQGLDSRWGVVDFGRTGVGANKQLPIAVTNIGNTDCTINSVAYDSATNTVANEFSIVDATGAPAITQTAATVHPGDTATYFAVFAPTHVLQSNSIFAQLSFGSYSPKKSQLGALGCAANSFECNGVDFVTSDTTTVDPTQGAANPAGLTYSIGFAGTPVTPLIDVIPPSLDFGEVTLGCGSPTLTTTIYNNGGDSIQVDQPTIAPASSPAQFTIESTTNSANTWPFTIDAGASLAITVRYHASAASLQTATMTLGTIESGSAGPNITVPLKGTGTTATQQTDTFDQFGDPKVDVLWIVDDSGSMASLQNQMAQNFSEFFVSSNVQNADFHIAVTTTLTADANCLPPPPTCTTSSDCGSGGQCVLGLCTAGQQVNSCADDPMCGWYTSCSNEHYLQQSSPNVESQFECNVKDANGASKPTRPGSDAAEGGFRASYRFLSPPNSTDPNINGGFLRDDAKLSVIMISDEPEQSKGSVDEYVTFFKNLKGAQNSNLISVSAIATDTNGCTEVDGTQATGDERYKTMVAAMNGRFQSICNPDWTTMMSQLGLDSLGLKVEFLLSRAAEPSSIQVCVKAGGASDPSCVAQTETSDGAANGWFYDAADNSVVFNAGSVPPRGSQIVVTYGTVCF
jgi:hypothetical protein